ncbi:MAG TPA: hypothetical protein VH597_10380 [Verrucomicrobiae bacterium]|jgi:hypothetical protein|nr:hypothetical protein [Verrucomicrobiae bacterium]
MKIPLFGSCAVVGLLLVGWQHQQLGHLRAENAVLEQASTESDQLKADLARSSGLEALDVDEISRLREENRDLLKLRNEVNQLRDARATFEKVSAENRQLQEQVKTAAKTNAKQAPMQPILIRIDSLYDRGQGTPENAVQTFLWAEHSANAEALSRCLTPERWSQILRSVGDGNKLTFVGSLQQNLDHIVSVEIVARRELNADTVQLGIQVYERQSVLPGKGVFTLHLRGGEWTLDITNKTSLYF